MSEIIPDPNVPVTVLGQDFLAWRFEDAPEKRNWFSSDELHPKHIDEILILRRRDSQTIENLVGYGKLINSIREIEKIYIKESSELEEQRIKNWLYNLGIPFQQKVILLNTQVVITTWKMVMKYFDSWTWSDVLIFDESRAWYVFNFHEDVIYYGDNRRAVVSQAVD